MKEEDYKKNYITKARDVVFDKNNEN